MTLDGAEYMGRPLSGEAVRQTYRRLLDAGNDRGAQDAVLLDLLRRCFPLSWRSLWSGDIARRVLRAPDRNALLAELLRVPDVPTQPEREPDEWDRLEAMQRVEEPGGPVVTLEMVCRLTEHQMGSGWYWNPARWPTADGYAPYDAVWLAWRTMKMARALDRLNVVRAIGITKAGKQATALYDTDVKEAFGG